jgi:hypothetical protein
MKDWKEVWQNLSHTIGGRGHILIDGWTYVNWNVKQMHDIWMYSYEKRGCKCINVSHR